jgi:hypothetical protein
LSNLRANLFGGIAGFTTINGRLSQLFVIIWNIMCWDNFGYDCNAGINCIRQRAQLLYTVYQLAEDNSTKISFITIL